MARLFRQRSDIALLADMADEIEKKSVNVRLEHSNPALDDEASAFLLAHGFTEGGLEPEDESDE